MNHIFRSLILASVIASFAIGAVAQQPFAPVMGAYQFSNGVHPVISAVFPNSDARTVSNFWKAELKAISAKVTDKKELIGAAARIPSASPDTIRILIATEQRKGDKNVVVRIAFQTRTGYVAQDSPEREITSCTEWVRQRSVTLLKQVAQKNLDEAQRQLDRYQRDLGQLERESDRAEESLRRTEQRGTDAQKEKAEADSILALPAGRAAGTDSLEAIADAKTQAKEQRAWTKRRDRAIYTSKSMDKKADDLRWASKKNKEDQEKQEAVIARQQDAVNGLKRDLDAIH